MDYRSFLRALARAKRIVATIANIPVPTAKILPFRLREAS